MKVFLADEGFIRDITRCRAKGHSGIRVAEDVGVMDTVQMRTDGTSLVVEKAEPDGTDEIYTVLCKEFGLVGYAQKLSSKISVIFCDGGWMLVTLHSGGIVVNLDGKPMLPTVGDFPVSSVSDDDILWLNADCLLGYRKFFDNVKSMFPYDFEFMFTVSGGNINSCANMHVSLVKDEDIDISLGHVAQWEQKKAMQNQMREVNALRSMFLSRTGTDDEEGGYEFDDEDFDEDEDDEYDDFADY